VCPITAGADTSPPCVTPDPRSGFQNELFGSWIGLVTSETGQDGGMAAPDTVTEAVNLLEAEGYTHQFGVQDHGLKCGSCGTLHDPTQAVIDRIFRFEGDSDPGDEAIVLGLRCPHCDLLGTLVSAYGPSADPDEVDVLTKLVDGRRR
jgi:hypothetical protein